MEEMDDLLNYGVETLSDVLKTHPHTKSAFKSMAEVIIEFSKYSEEQNKGMAGSLLRESSS